MPLTRSEYKNLSEICRDVAQVIFAALVVSQLAAGFDTIQWSMVSLGLIISFVLWFCSSIFAEEGKL